MSRIVCLSHKEDVDGISSAALIKAAFKTKSVIVLVDYANIIQNLQKLALSSATERRTDRFFVCDLGIKKKKEGKILENFGKICSSGAKGTYNDPHDLSMETALALKKLGVVL